MWGPLLSLAVSHTEQLCVSPSSLRARPVGSGPPTPASLPLSPPQRPRPLGVRAPTFAVWGAGPHGSVLQWLVLSPLGPHSVHPALPCPGRKAVLSPRGHMELLGVRALRPSPRPSRGPLGPSGNNYPFCTNSPPATSVGVSPSILKWQIRSVLMAGHQILNLITRRGGGRGRGCHPLTQVPLGRAAHGEGIARVNGRSAHGACVVSGPRAGAGDSHALLPGEGVSCSRHPGCPPGSGGSLRPGGRLGFQGALLSPRHEPFCLGHPRPRPQSGPSCAPSVGRPGNRLCPQLRPWRRNC